MEKQLSEGRTEQATTLKLEIAALTSQTGKGLDGIRSVVDSKLGVIGEQVQQKLDQNIKEGFAQFEKVQQHLAEAEKQLRNVGEIGASINDLNNLLKLPHLRGRFGEESLERLLADFLPAQMYELQAAPAMGVAGRVDAVIKFPDRNLPIDAKFPREQVQALFEGSDPAALETARIDFVRVMKEQARRIAGYIHPESGTTDMALMYLPSETLYMEAVRSGEITEHLNKLQVFAVSPNTLIVTLKSIQMVFKMYEFAKGYEKATAELGKAQKSFGFFERHFDEIGKSLNKAQDAYGTAKRHLNTYARRVTDLTGQEVPQLGAAADMDDDPAA
ncbi:MAG TPA: DNA recombination protein RmuC [Candidatus Binataceae bacterium]|nr:DNA recombination protein RmuC [Candidatus Binataceae bacterium]